MEAMVRLIFLAAGISVVLYAVIPAAEAVATSEWMKYALIVIWGGIASWYVAGLGQDVIDWMRYRNKERRS
jgi:hypothetical protein